MFIGHYGLGFAGRKLVTGPSLGTMFLAVQWLDLIWPLFVLFGIERFSIEPGNTVLTPLNFEHYPWSHSMLMALAWGLLFGIIYFGFTKNRRGAILLCVLVFSHWILDWLTHRPDLQLTPFSPARVGFGLWDHPWTELPLELGIFIIGVLLYAGSTHPRNNTGKWTLWSLVALLGIIHFMNVFGPPPPGTEMVAIAALSQWLFVAWGFWIDRNRMPN